MNLQSQTDKAIYVLEDLDRLVTHLAKDHAVLQICQDDEGEKNWTESIQNGVSPLYGSANIPMASPKSLFFAENEALYKFDGESFKAINPDVLPRALIGVQACDLTAIAYQDRFFKDDPYYQAKRQKTLLVGIDCESPCANGFCTIVDAGPHVNAQTADLILSRIEKSTSDGSQPWLLIAETAKGLNSINGLALEPAQTEHVVQRSEQHKLTCAKFDDFTYISNSVEYLNDNLIPAAVWQELSVQCLSCSGCTNLCPTCSCYTVYETNSTEKASEYTTFRNWDSCLFEGFQKEASGHNPSHEAAKRVERFWFHKFSDEYLPEFGRYGCVGCGRCESTCPGVIGVHSIMKRIDQACCN
jgi:formate hydrogenlyase subunit 6/NADH:ubiquinone oxidoreductase subunit I